MHLISGKHAQYMDKWVSTLSIFFTHLQTIAVLGNLRLVWPPSAKAVTGVLSLSVTGLTVIEPEVRQLAQASALLTERRLKVETCRLTCPPADLPACLCLPACLPCLPALSAHQPCRLTQRSADRASLRAVPRRGRQPLPRLLQRPDGRLQRPLRERPPSDG